MQPENLKTGGNNPDDYTIQALKSPHNVPLTNFLNAQCKEGSF